MLNNNAAIKPAFLKFINLIRKYRLKELGKVGCIAIPKTELDEIASLELDKFIGRLILAEVLFYVTPENLDLSGFGASQNKSLKYIYAVVDETECLIIATNTAESLESYLKKLRPMVDCDLEVNLETRTIYKPGQRKKQSHPFSEQEFAVFIYLYQNNGIRKAMDEIIEFSGREGININKGSIAIAINNIKRRLGELGYTGTDIKRMIPRGSNNSYIFQFEKPS